MFRFLCFVFSLLFGIAFGFVNVALADAPKLTFSRSAASPREINIQGHRMLAYVLNVAAADMPEDSRENIAEIPTLEISAFLQYCTVSNVTVYPAEFDGDHTLGTSAVSTTNAKWVATLTSVGGVNTIREQTTRTYKIYADIVADPPGAFAEMRAVFNVEPALLVPPSVSRPLYIDAKEATPVNGVVGISIWGDFPDGVVSVEATIITDIGLPDAQVTLGSWDTKGTWIIESHVSEGMIKFSAAGAVPFHHDTWSPFNLSFTPPPNLASVGFAFQEVVYFNEMEVRYTSPEVDVVRIVRPVPARFVGDGKVIDGVYALPVGGKAVLKLDAKAPGGLTNIRVAGGTDKAEPRLLRQEIALNIVPFGGDAEGYHFEGWGNWVEDPQFDGIVGLILSFTYESGPLEIRANGEGPVLQSLIVIVPRYGDGNGDGRVKVVDAVLAIRHGGTAAQNKALDVSGNGSVGAYDAALILQCAAGLITTFPVEGPKVALSPTATPVSEAELLQGALKTLQEKAPETLQEFEKAGGSLNALAGVNPKGKLATTWGGTKSAR